MLSAQKCITLKSGNDNTIMSLKNFFTIIQQKRIWSINERKKLIIFIIPLIIGKIILLSLFSSDYQNKLFIPFVRHFITHFDNPWNYFYQNQLGVEFPYHPLMLYILSFFYLPVSLFSIDSVIIQNLIFKLPILLSDIAITIVLYRLFPTKLKSIILFYFISPIILYSSYVHSQLDIIPTALLLISIYLLIKNRLFLSSILIGLALSTKFHIAAGLPLIAIYILKNYSIRRMVIYIIPAVLIYFIFSSHYLFSPGYFHLVLSNPKQMLIYDVWFKIGPLKIYLPIFSMFIIYARFLIYNKINYDLLFSYLAMLFAIFVFFIIPAPGWYVWMLPFLTIIFIKSHTEENRIAVLYVTLSISYLLFFVLFFIPEFQDIIFLSRYIDYKITDERLTNIFFTLLEVILLGNIYICYKYGIKTNAIYKRQHATVIGISGDSGVGKTTLLGDIKALLNGKVIHLEGDADHKWERGNEKWDEYTHLHPKANYLHRQAEDILDLKLGKTVYRHDYEHHTGTFSEPKKIKPRDFILLSGLHTFYIPKMRKIVDLKIFMNTDEALRTHWKTIRDVEKRGYLKEKVIEQIDRRKNDTQKFISPQKQFADMIINYYPDGEFDIGDISANPNIKLKITLDSSIHIEKLISYLGEEKIDIIWDYQDDLKLQYIIFNSPIDKSIIERTARRIILNIDEVLANRPIWLGGFRGIVQLITLLSLTEKMKEEIIVNQENSNSGV